MLAVQPTKYIYPPRAENSIPKEAIQDFLNMGYIPQYKYNDSRCVIKILPKTPGSPLSEQIELWNRHGERFRSYYTPDWLLEQIDTLRDILCLNPESWTLLDGGLLDQKHQAIKDTIVIWDILVRDGTHLLGTTYKERLDSLTHAIRITEQGNWYYTSTKHDPIDFGYKISDNLLLAKNNPQPTISQIWDVVEMVNAPYTVGDNIKPVLEGVMLKDPNGTLSMGFKEKNNMDWLIKSRVKTGRHLF